MHAGSVRQHDSNGVGRGDRAGLLAVGIRAGLFAVGVRLVVIPILAVGFRIVLAVGIRFLRGNHARRGPRPYLIRDWD